MWNDIIDFKQTVKAIETIVYQEEDGQKHLGNDNPYTSLWVAVIKQAISDKDIRYLAGSGLKNTCDLLNIERDLIVNSLPDTLQNEVRQQITRRRKVC
jgi:hypothetical protein